MDQRVLFRGLVACVTALCVVSIAASSFLALSYVMLKGTADLQPITVLGGFVLEAGVTLLALRVFVSGVAIDLLTLAGALALAWIGGSIIERAVTSAHFEGYAVLMGGLATVQGALTFMLFAWRLTKGSSSGPVAKLPAPVQR